MKYLYMILSTIIWLSIGFLLTVTVYDEPIDMKSDNDVTRYHPLVSTFHHRVDLACHGYSQSITELIIAQHKPTNYNKVLIRS